MEPRSIRPRRQSAAAAAAIETELALQSHSPPGTSAMKKADRKKPLYCQVDCCGIDLSTTKMFCQRYRVCEVHIKMASVLISGQECRFCQQCTRFQPVEAFDGGKRSCRERLGMHNSRRKIRRDAESSLQHALEQQATERRPAVQMIGVESGPSSSHAIPVVAVSNTPPPILYNMDVDIEREGGRPASPLTSSRNGPLSDPSLAAARGRGARRRRQLRTTMNDTEGGAPGLKGPSSSRSLDVDLKSSSWGGSSSIPSAPELAPLRMPSNASVEAEAAAHQGDNRRDGNPWAAMGRGWVGPYGCATVKQERLEPDDPASWSLGTADGSEFQEDMAVDSPRQRSLRSCVQPGQLNKQRSSPEGQVPYTVARGGQDAGGARELHPGVLLVNGQPRFLPVLHSQLTQPVRHLRPLSLFPQGEEDTSGGQGSATVRRPQSARQSGPMLSGAVPGQDDGLAGSFLPGTNNTVAAQDSALGSASCYNSRLHMLLLQQQRQEQRPLQQQQQQQQQQQAAGHDLTSTSGPLSGAFADASYHQPPTSRLNSSLRIRSLDNCMPLHNLALGLASTSSCASVYNPSLRQLPEESGSMMVINDLDSRSSLVSLSMLRGPASAPSAVTANAAPPQESLGWAQHQHHHQQQQQQQQQRHQQQQQQQQQQQLGMPDSLWPAGPSICGVASPFSLAQGSLYQAHNLQRQFSSVRESASQLPTMGLPSCTASHASLADIPRVVPKMEYSAAPQSTGPVNMFNFDDVSMMSEQEMLDVACMTAWQNTTC